MKKCLRNIHCDGRSVGYLYRIHLKMSVEIHFHLQAIFFNMTEHAHEMYPQKNVFIDFDVKLNSVYIIANLG